MRKAEEFSTVFDRGRSVADRTMVLHWLAKNDGPTRVGFCVGRKIGSAVRRNRIKRLLREGWRQLSAKTETPVDLVFVARSGGVQLSLTEWMDAMQFLLRRAGILDDNRG